MIINKNSKKIIIPIEIKVREFLPKSYLAYKILLNSNFDVVIGAQRNFTNQLIYKNCVLLDKNTKSKDREIFPIHKNNYIAMLDEEGPISFQHRTIIKERYHISELKDQIDSFMFSGKKDLENIELNHIKNKIYVVGHPKFDFLKSDLELIFKKENKYIRKNFKNFVLITGHFPSSSVRTTNNWITNVSKKILGDDTNLKKHVKNRLKFNSLRKKNYESLISFTIKLAEENPDTQFIFRRHPMENENFIKDKFYNKPKNLKLVYKFSVTPWIHNCMFHIHSGCQSSLETIKLKKRLITYMPFYSKEYFKNYKNFNPFFKRELDCLKFLKKKKFFKNKFDYKNMEHLLYNFSKKNSYNEIIKILRKKYNNIQSEIIFKKIKKDSFYKIFNLYLKVGSYLKSSLNKISLIQIIFAKFLPHLTNTKEEKNLKLKTISHKEMTDTIRLFLKADNIKKKIFIKKLSNSTFYLSKK